MLDVKKRLKSIRKEKNYTQGFVAEKLGISLRAYSKIESGETQMTIERLNDIVTILDVNPNQILGCDFDEEVPVSKNNNPSNDSISLIQHYEETITILKEHIETLKHLLEKK